MVEIPAAPALATVAGVELGSVGYWNISNIQDWHPTPELFAAAIAALDCPSIRRPVLKFGHVEPAGEGDPTLGHVDNLRMTEDGQTLVGDLVGLPAWLAEADAEGRSVLASAYPDRSGEFFFDHVCASGHTHPCVLRAVALLGVWEPGIATLESLYDLYTKAPEKEVAVAKSAVALAGTTADQIRKAYYAGPGRDWDLWIREMFVDPPELIVQNDGDDSIERVAYTITGDGEVEFADGQKVKVEYVAARAKAETPTVAYASRTEARPAAAAAPESPSAAEAEVTPDGKEGAMPTLKEGLAQTLGIAADADDETLLKAFQDALGNTGAEPDADADPGAAADDAGTLATLPQLAAAAKAHGMQLVDDASAAQQRADASAGRQALARIQRDDDERVVDAAIADGKVFESRRAHYLGLMERDREGTTAWLASVPKEAAVPMSEVGHATEAVEDVATDPTYKNWRF